MQAVGFSIGTKPKWPFVVCLDGEVFLCHEGAT